MKKIFKSTMRVFRLPAVFWAACVLCPAGAAAEEAERTAPRVYVVSPANTEAAVQHVRGILSTLNDANRSGNYAVLRELAAPEFQDEHSLEDLVRSFAPLRESNIDFTFVNRTTPEFNASSLIDSDGAMMLEGRFRGTAEDLHFGVKLVEIEGRWRMRSLDVSTRASQRAAHIKTVPSRGAQPALRLPPATPPAPNAVPSAAKESNVIVRSFPMAAPVKVVVPEGADTVAETGVLRQIIAGPHAGQAGANSGGSADLALSESRTTWGVRLGPSVNPRATK